MTLRERAGKVLGCDPEVVQFKWLDPRDTKAQAGIFIVQRAHPSPGSGVGCGTSEAEAVADLERKAPKGGAR